MFLPPYGQWPSQLIVNYGLQTFVYFRPFSQRLHIGLKCFMAFSFSLKRNMLNLPSANSKGQNKQSFWISVPLLS